MGFEITGRLHAIQDTQQITERFRKREFVVELDENPRFPQLVLFQLTGDRTEAIEGFRVGERVQIEFSLRGREWTSPSGDVKYFNSLDVWAIRHGDSSGEAEEGVDYGEESSGAGTDPDDDLPF